MIISENKTPSLQAFEQLLNNAHQIIKNESIENSEYFIKRTASEFEEDIYHSLQEAAKNTPFENTIELISGHKFPDIIAKKIYGVEVKTTKQNHWKSVGNSILESTRVDLVENIFIYFGKLTDPVDFKYKYYQDCLYDIAVTHSPRYLIDMNIEKEDSIFSKLKIEYNELRKLTNPVKPFIDYYRKLTKPGEEPWWMNENNNLASPTIKIFSNLSINDKKQLIIKAIAFFPEIFGRKQTKYQKVAGWLASQYGVVDSSLRDRFTAGGKVNIQIGENSYTEIPHVYKNLSIYFEKIISTIESSNIDDLKYYWGLENLSEHDNLIEKWLSLVLNYSNESFPGGEKFIINLFGSKFIKNRPDFIQKKYVKYNLK